MTAIREEDVRAALRTVKDPEFDRDILALNMVRELAIGDDGKVSIAVETKKPDSTLQSTLQREISGALIRVSGVKGVNVTFGAKIAAPAPPADTASRGGQPQGALSLPGIKHVVAVASGKGGVGKSTVAVNLAAALAQTGAAVGLLDADIYGPNVPLMTGLMDEQPEITIDNAPDGSQIQLIQPVRRHGLKVMSIGFLINEDQPVVWRGPMLNSAMRQFLGQVAWGDLDYLIVDLPPGTGDVQISLVQLVKITGVVYVTTPQDVALQDVRKGVAMFAAQRVPGLGIIENMSYFECPHCGEKTEIFSSGGGERFATLAGLHFLGAIPLDAKVRESGDSGAPLVIGAPDSPQARRFRDAATQLVEQVKMLSFDSAQLPLNVR